MAKAATMKVCKCEGRGVIVCVKVFLNQDFRNFIQAWINFNTFFSYKECKKTKVSQNMLLSVPNTVKFGSNKQPTTRL